MTSVKVKPVNYYLLYVYPEVPPKVEYSLTETGLELIPFIDHIGVWGEKQMAKENAKG